MIADRGRFRRRFHRIVKRAGQGENCDQAIAHLQVEVDASTTRSETRKRLLPAPRFPDELPITAHVAEIKKLLLAHQVLIVAGETGSGKTTQLPKICLAAGRGVYGVIGCTQPRRIAARSIAEKLSGELSSELGSVVGYKVRFTDRSGVDGYIKLMTDGILLAEIHGDPLLRAYDTLILDEAHERSLNVDVLLGYLKTLLPKRPELKVIITSATINVERFSAFFGDAPITEVSGRTFPVEVRYRPVVEAVEDARDLAGQHAISNALDEIAETRGEGDILIFLSGEREIRDTAEQIRKHHPANTEILPLYARLSAAEQSRVFKPSVKRRIVLATNVAETSLTIPRIRYVIDPGYARVSRYSLRTKVQRLPVEKVSRASADQRKGRCGRMSAGVCIRLYSEQDYLDRPRFTEPELLRTNLASVILRMKSVGIGDITAFPFVDPPDRRMIRGGFRTLEELGALNSAGELTALGYSLARFPIDPRIARMILAANDENCLREVLIIASALAVQDPRERPQERQNAADEAHMPFSDTRSDFLSFLSLWRFLAEQSKHLSKNKMRTLCRDRYLSFIRVQEWREIHRQLYGLVTEMGLRPNQDDADYSGIHRALLTGLLTNIACKADKHSYTGTHQKKLYLFPGSALFETRPKWIVSAELVETSRLYARCAAKIQPQWVEHLAPLLCRRDYFSPHWSRKSAQVLAYERTTLYGLIVNPRRRVNYARINPLEAREIFLRHAFVEGEYDGEADFVKDNQSLIRRLEGFEHKLRKRDIVADEEARYQFYNERIPASVHDGVTFSKWYRRAALQDRKALFMRQEEMLLQPVGEVAAEQFPDEIAVAGLRFNLNYLFEPGHDMDGVTVTVPVFALNLLPKHGFDWLVPGLLREKIIALLKSLPKSLRRSFVPVPSVADHCVEALTPYKHSLLHALTTQLGEMTGVEVPAESWRMATVASYLFMNYRVVTAEGRVVAVGRDLERLRAQHGVTAQQQYEAIPKTGLERQAVTRWDFGDLPRRIEFEQAGARLYGHPAIVARDDTVDVVIFDDEHNALSQHRKGVRRLFMLEASHRVKYVRNNLPDIRAMCAAYQRLGRCESLKNDLMNVIVDRALQTDPADIRTQQAFNERKERAVKHLMLEASELCALVGEIFLEYEKLYVRLYGKQSLALLASLADIREQLEHLIFRGFVVQTSRDALTNYVRYIRGIGKRLDRLEQDPARDKRKMTTVLPFWEKYWRLAEGQKEDLELGADADRFRWMLEEYRVSVFAQELGTPYPVSTKRLEADWEKISR